MSHPSGRGLLAVAGIACITAAADGACTALTVIPPALLLATGLTLVCAVWRKAAPSVSWPYAAIGIAAGLALPSTPPPVAGSVVTRAPESALRGDIFAVLDRIDDDPALVIGRRVSVTGMWSPATRDRLATISRRVMSCCAADAVDVGFDVVLRRPQRVERGAWVRVDGFVRERIDGGEVRYLLEQSAVSGLEDPSEHLDNPIITHAPSLSRK